MAEAQRNIYPPLHSDDGNVESGEETLKTLRKHHDKAYADIRMALKFDEQSNRKEAIRFYSIGLKSIAKAMEIDCTGPQRTGSEWDHARSMQKKMKKTALQMKARLESLERDAQSSVCSAESHGACGSDSILSIYEEDDTVGSLPSYAESTTDAREVLHIPHGVQLFFINSSGHVSAPSSPGQLRVYTFPDGERLGQNQPPAFLQVGEWLYPLLPGRSPSLKAADGVFMFPDVSSPDQGASVGVIFAKHVSKSQKAKFQQLIEQLTAMKEEQMPEVEEAASEQVPQDRNRVPRDSAPLPQISDRVPEGRTVEQDRTPSSQMDGEEVPTGAVEGEEHTARIVGRKIAKGIEIGAEWISWGVVKGAELGSRLVGSGAKKLKENIKPDEQPKEIDEKYQTGMLYAKKASGVAVKVSAVVLDGVCYMTKRIAEELGPVISKQANKLLTTGEDEVDGKRKAMLDGVVDVTASGIKGFGQVYRGLEAAAVQLAKSISHATVETVQHKYGTDAGRITDSSLKTVANIGVSAHNLNNLGVKALAKRTAKDTGKEVVRDLNDKKDDEAKVRQS
ncbi:spartin-like [Diadema setosum]|uniref:spartin-like n=1 Tax=Diadema setosum TaxID=31175 RepID=UPI003B3B03C0